MAANTYGRQVVVPLTNKSGGGVIAGDVVIIDTTNNDAFTTSTSGAYTGMVGVAQETIANNAVGRVLTAGYAALVLTSGSVTRGNFGATHTVAKQAADIGARAVGAFCQFLTGGTTPDAHLFGFPDGTAASGAPTTADYLVGTAQGGLSAEIVVGTTPGGELGNTWASPTVDATHSGSAHPTATINSISGNTTMTTANTYYDGPSLSLNGKYFLSGTVTVKDNSGSGGQEVTAKLWNGTTVIASAQITMTANYHVCIALSGYVETSGAETWKISAAADTNTNLILAAATTNGAGNNASTLTAVKIG